MNKLRAIFTKPTKLRTTIALACLRFLFPKELYGVQHVVVLPLRGLDLQERSDLLLEDLIQAPQVVLRAGHPNRNAQPLSQSLGSLSVQFPSSALRVIEPVDKSTTKASQP